MDLTSHPDQLSGPSAAATAPSGNHPLGFELQSVTPSTRSLLPARLVHHGDLSSSFDHVNCSSGRTRPSAIDTQSLNYRRPWSPTRLRRAWSMDLRWIPGKHANAGPNRAEPYRDETRRHAESPSKFVSHKDHSSVIYCGRAKPWISVTRHDRAVNYRITNCRAREGCFSTSDLEVKLLRPTREICYPDQHACLVF